MSAPLHRPGSPAPGPHTSGGWLAAHIPGEGPVALTRTEIALPAGLARGSLMAEFSLARGAPETAVPLVQLTRQGEDPRSLSIALDAEGHLQLIQRRGAEFHALSIDASAARQSGGRMRMLWRWDTARGDSLLSLEMPGGGALRQRAGHGPLALTREDVRALISGGAQVRFGPTLDWIALGDHLQPVGPGACFAPATPIETPQGPRPAGSLRAGDLVETVDAGPQEVLWSGRIALPALGGLRPVRLCPPGFGETRDLWLMARHRIALSGPAIDYLFDHEEVLVAAGQLIDGCHALQPAPAGVLHWQGLLLAGHHLLIADGCRIESLYAGRLARQPALAATTALAEMARAGRLPEHGTPVRPVLADWEAEMLALHRAQTRSPVAA